VGEHNNTTPAADSIVITEKGRYMVIGQFSSSCGTGGVVVRKALFLNGAEVDKIHKYCKFTNQDQYDSGSFSGIIDVQTVPAYIDVRVRHDNVGSVNMTGAYGNLSITKIGY